MDRANQSFAPRPLNARSTTHSLLMLPIAANADVISVPSTAVGASKYAAVGLVPQAIHQLGGYRVAGRTQEEADRLVEDALALEQAGAFAIVLECIPVEVAAAVTAKLTIPTIGIGAGPHCDGQVLVSYDAFGLFDEIAPKFVKRYAHLGDQMIAAAKQYITEVERGEFPDPEHSFRFPASTATRE